MTTFTDGAPPSVSPGPDGDSGPAHRKEDGAADPSPLWLRHEIQRLVAAKGGKSGGRHARPESPEGAVRPDTADHLPQRAPPRVASAPPPAPPFGGRSAPPAPPNGLPRTDESARGASAPPPQFAPGSPTNRIPGLPGELFRGGVDGMSQPGPPAPAPVQPVAPRPSGPDQPVWYPRPVAVPEPRRPDARDATDDDPTAVGLGGAPERVRVVLSERNRAARTVRTVEVVQDSDGVGELLRNGLISSQLAIALRFAVVAGLTLGLLPMLFAVFPAIGRAEVLGLRLPWLLLGVLVYPFLLGLGWWHTHTAERVEENFVAHVRG